MLSAPFPSHFVTTNFLTIKEAARLVGKSPSSIRRVIYPILESDSHPNRVHILPSVEEALQLRMKGESFGWRLSEELLRREVPVDAGSEKSLPDSKRSTSDGGHAELLAMLRRELDIKNQQIAQQAELISKQVELVSGLSERLREGNILMGSLQQRLALSDGREATTVEPTKPKSAIAVKPGKGSAASTKTVEFKRGLLARWFRSRP